MARHKRIPRQLTREERLLNAMADRPNDGRRTGGHVHDAGAYLPTQTEIAAMCAMLRAARPEQERVRPVELREYRKAVRGRVLVFSVV